MLTIVTWLWGRKYGAGYVERLAAGVARNLAREHRFLCVTERDLAVRFSPGIERSTIQDPELLLVRGCFARLRMFDPEWQREHRVDDRILCLDLDVVVTGSLDSLAGRSDSFAILQGVNARNPCPFNGSVILLRAGHHREVWRDFSLERAGELPRHDFPDDQGWLHHVIPSAGKIGPADGVYAYRKPGWPRDDKLPANCAIVAFPGHRDPSQFESTSWIREHWR